MFHCVFKDVLKGVVRKESDSCITKLCSKKDYSCGEKDLKGSALENLKIRFQQKYYIIIDKMSLLGQSLTRVLLVEGVEVPDVLFTKIFIAHKVVMYIH